MDAKKELKLLTDLEILSIGLVKKGANLSPFFLIKNLEGEVMEREQLEKELEELESVEEVSRSEWDRLLKVIRNLLPFKKEEDSLPPEGSREVEEKQEPAEAAAKKALEILQRFSHIEEIREAIKRLAAYVGYPYPFPYPKPKAEEVEMEDEKAKKAVKQALKILEPFRELEELKRAVALLATFVGYPYPKPARKSETEEALEKKLEALQKEALDYKRELEEVKKRLTSAALRRTCPSVSCRTTQGLERQPR